MTTDQIWLGVGFLGQAAGLFVYTRNLYFIYRHPERIAHG